MQATQMDSAGVLLYLFIHICNSPSNNKRGYEFERTWGPENMEAVLERKGKGENDVIIF